MKMRDYCRVITVFSVFVLVFSLFATPSHAKTKGEINASARAALRRFKQEIKGGTEYLKGAKGMLVMPGITKAGFVIGGKYGQGALLVGSNIVGYYSLAEGSVGWQIGAEQYDMVILFMTDDVLNKFKRSENWEAGIDAEITLIAKGAEVSVETLRSQHPIAGFIFGQKGLMGGLSIKGAKFTRIHPH
jgi:lipid-binding SYLF domain-containing protein